MTKTCIATFSGFVVALSVYAAQNPTGYINAFIETNPVYISLRIAIIAGLMAYAFIPSVRTFFARGFMATAGLALMAFGLATIFSPTLFGYLTNYYSIGDSIIFLESGILARLIGIELPAHKPMSLENSIVKYDSSLASFQTLQLADSPTKQRGLAIKPALNV